MWAPSPSSFSSIFSHGWRWHGRCCQMGSGLDTEQRAGKGRQTSAGISISEGLESRKASSLLLGDVGLQGGEVEWASQTRATAPVSHDCWAVHLELLTLVLHPRFPRKDLALPFISFLEKPPGNTQVSPHLPQTAPVSCQFCSLTSPHSPVSWLVSFSVPSPFQTTLRSNRDQTKAPPY